MSTTPIAQPTATVPVPEGQREIRIISHSTLFYWWPVWAVGFLMAFITLVNGHPMILVPVDTKVESQRAIPWENNDTRDILVAPAKAKVLHDKGGRPEPHVLVA